MPTKTKKANQSKKIIVTEAPVAVKRRSVDFYLLATIFIILCISLIRWRLVHIPLERDEGEYAYIGKLILKGMAPYKYAYNMKLPGTYFMYALLMGIFGQTIEGIHTGFLIMNAATMFIFFLAFRKLYDSSIAFFASSAYGIMALSGTVLGFAAHATHFVSFFVALGMLCLAIFYDRQTILLSFLTGVMFGLSFLMKQQAMFFLVFAGFAILMPWLLKKPIVFKPITKYGIGYTCGAVLPYAFSVVLLDWAGAFDKFWFWTVKYASKYASGLPFNQGQIAFKSSFLPMWNEFGFLWLLFFAGLILIFFSRFPLKQKLLAVGFAVFGFFSVCPGFYFRQHYFVSLLPAIGLLSAISLSVIFSFISKSIKIKSLSFLLPFVFILCFVTTLSLRKEYYLVAEPDEISKRYYTTNPFVESVEIAEFVKQNSLPSDKIAIVGSEPQIYFYSDRFSATGYLYTYGLVENQDYNRQMQEEMIAEIEKVKPKLIVYSKVEFSWLYHSGAPRRIYEWADEYTNRYYEVAGVVDEINPEQTVYKWNEEAKNYTPTGADFLKVYKRK